MISNLDSFLSNAPMEGHVPVLSQETLTFLDPKGGGVYLDCTFGGGGHTRMILEAADTSVVALDQDPQAIERADQFTQEFGDRFQFRRMNFANLENLEEGPFDGILFDFGVSSFQLDQLDRGFSFRGEAPLDMRMNPETGISAADWLASASRRELIQAIRAYGEEKNWRRIVDAIIEARTQSPLKATQDLSELILSCTPARLRFASKIHPATKTFQGIRIAVNNEIDVIEVGLPAAFKRLKPNGRLCVISFHSLEDRIAKNLFRRWAGRPEPGDNRPQDMREVKAELLTRRPAVAGDAEVAVNSRSRSAKLRVLRKAES
ncbi:16S rRNA (cytosine(1402)-N(4))-methyltransferase RsmH [Candidatus Pelagisphaera phototrophica]|uniref:16S rRNA (cytosine(1402)-N(4))-methyltransferase RsmH n=1 Tax=Candidatus Pelagisphaera phototrophica TaxID=2684113 RepID=UPI0024B6CCA2|nr:16S rRNA (cytosine(1402)-N(4))-methyltransferase RsmH [Candidatus Pelagisphaera phototrophica]